MKSLKKKQNIVNELKKIKLPEQKSQEWLDMRNGMITASDFGSILGHNKYSSRNQVLKNKCFVGKRFEGNKYTRWGEKYESVVTAIYEFKNKEKINEFGCLQHPKYNFIGASPDGITDNGRMVEIKVPSTREIKDNEIPESYYDQMQGQLEVCDLDECDFVQCKILEYKYLEFFKDFSSEFKGCSINLENEHIYSSLNLNKEEHKKWLLSEKSRLKKENNDIINITYWKLDKYSCQLVKRSDTWMKESLPLFEKFWKEVIYFREHIDEIPKRQKKIKKFI